MTFTERRFHWADYLVFCASLLLSVVIGLYHAYLNKNKSTTSDYLMGGRDMSILPVSASMVVSLLSAIFLQGTPAEIYAYGFYMILEGVGFFCAITIACLFYMPVYHRLKITSVFEYLELRYDRNVRLASSVLSMIQMICYSSVALYAPAIAVSQATGLPVWSCILISAAICTFYTAIGGFKTVLWTDTLQCGIMIVGLIATLIKGSVDAGGMAQVWNISDMGQRTYMTNVMPDPLARHTIWNWLWGEIPFFMSMYATSQFAVQRFNSIGNLDKARVAMMLAIPIQLLLGILACFTGLVAFTFYYGCDPMKTGRIKSRDQTLSLLVMDVFQYNPGMAGVFLASILSAALSTLSSVQNSFTAILLEDILKPLKHRITGHPVTERKGIFISKVIVLIVGIIITCLAIVASRSGKLVLTLAASALAIGASPILGIFTLGIFVPFCNSKGALVGLISGVLFLGWIVVGSLTTPGVLHKPLPTQTHLCPIGSLTINRNTTATRMPTNTITDGYDIVDSTSSATMRDQEVRGISRLYQVSFILYNAFGTLPAILLGIIVSLMTGGWKQRGQVRSDLMFSFKKHGLPWCREPDVSDRTKDDYTPVEAVLGGHHGENNIMDEREG